MNNEALFNAEFKSLERYLQQFGFEFDEKLATDPKLWKDYLCLIYSSQQSQRSLSVSYYILDKELGFSVSMWKIPKEKSFFSLDWYLEDNGMDHKIKLKYDDDSDFAEKAKSFFKDLQSILENELHDQLLGKTFENHHERLMESMNSY